MLKVDVTTAPLLWMVGAVHVLDPDTADATADPQPFVFDVSPAGVAYIENQPLFVNRSSLDFESQSSFVIINVTARDARDSSLAVSQQFTLLVQDLNESPTSDVPNGTATDRRTVQLVLAAGATLNYEVRSVFVVTVTATDQGGLSATSQILVFVQDRNDAPTTPTITSNRLPENTTALPFVVGTLQATDEDTSQALQFAINSIDLRHGHWRNTSTGPRTCACQAMPTSGVALACTTATNSRYAVVLVMLMSDACMSAGCAWSDVCGSNSNDDGGYCGVFEGDLEATAQHPTDGKCTGTDKDLCEAEDGCAWDVSGHCHLRSCTAISDATKCDSQDSCEWHMHCSSADDGGQSPGSSICEKYVCKDVISHCTGGCNVMFQCVLAMARREQCERRRQLHQGVPQHVEDDG
ncbi:hypothetical protein PTSG_09048 [Salpingoeca rosetta]|uniref:Cadherin domain-containing protein n=1 Tax=Salpingoeca rosetta (strain ATCC 50818 / BSB-021) TaxID=946362 RepID=F2UM22_SALR5|nr:uncharacterized protein PTSG_09048 [Salpingoeca rosetta]EGD78171.1 hypothetical protein PTSG_09048 [Salpingoeca rosetta]|eukprot:XP_004989847.1 hypothetical protein PTSG_09048 [Salpingoeca rosetta]